MIPLDLIIAEFPAFFFDVAAKGLLLLTIAVVAVRFMKRNSAEARHLTLALALGALLVLPALSWTLPRLGVLPQWMSLRLSPSITVVKSEYHAPGHTLPERNNTEDGVLVATVFSPALSHTASLSSPAPNMLPPTNSWPISRWLLTVWLLGVCCAVAPTVAALFSLWLLRHKSQAIQSATLQGLLSQLKQSMSYQREILLLTASARRMPMMWGLFRPVILLPADSVNWPQERQRLVLLHELAHIERHDFLTTLIMRLACALHWFNPLAWIAARRICQEQEQACDDIVLREGAAPEDYAEEILQFAAGQTVPPFESLGAVAMARPSSLEGRLLSILDYTRDRAPLNRARTLTAILLVAIAIIPMSMVRAAQTATPLIHSGSQATGLDHGLVAWWRGDDDANDSAGNHAGTVPFGARFFPGLAGKAFNFIRSHAIEDQLQRVSIADSPDFQLTETVTLEAWIYPMKYGGIVLFRGDDRGGYDTWQVDLMTDGHISYVFNTADNQGFGINAPIRLNQWQHFAAVFDRGRMSIYINGILANEKQTDLRPIAVLDAAANPALGIGNTGGKHYNMPFDGLIDEVRIYNRALSEAEIRERMKH